MKFRRAMIYGLSYVDKYNILYQTSRFCRAMVYGLGYIDEDEVLYAKR